jgi:hypothetical protein
LAFAMFLLGCVPTLGASAQTSRCADLVTFQVSDASQTRAAGESAAFTLHLSSLADVPVQVAFSVAPEKGGWTVALPGPVGLPAKTASGPATEDARLTVRSPADAHGVSYAASVVAHVTCRDAGGSQAQDYRQSILLQTRAAAPGVPLQALLAAALLVALAAGRRGRA